MSNENKHRIGIILTSVEMDMLEEIMLMKGYSNKSTTIKDAIRRLHEKTFPSSSNATQSIYTARIARYNGEDVDVRNVVDRVQESDEERTKKRIEVKKVAREMQQKEEEEHKRNICTDVLHGELTSNGSMCKWDRYTLKKTTKYTQERSLDYIPRSEIEAVRSLLVDWDVSNPKQMAKFREHVDKGVLPDWLLDKVV